jgi:large subunit ribosomal protein L9
MSTRIILRSDIATLGKRGDIVEVSDGHFRNYLSPRGLAIKATDGAVAQAGSMRRARDLRDAHDREGAQTIAQALVAKTITIPVKAGAEGRLYGSVTASDVAAAVEEQTGILLDRKKLSVPAIKATGEHTVVAKLHNDVEFPITVAVTAR